MARHTASAMAASSWLAMPNSGKNVLIPPSGSVTPRIRMDPQPATMMAVVSHAPARQSASRNLGMKLPRVSVSMKRATRVPASTAVRMNRASNMIAKWYQKLIMEAPPSHWCMMCDSPSARVGAPPVREMMVSSPTASAVPCSSSGVTCTPERPSEFTNAAAPSTVPMVAAGEEFIAK